MRILIANKYYFMRGGAERLLFNTKAILEAHGHTVVPFAIRFARSEPTPASRFFVDPPAGQHEIELEQFRIKPHRIPGMVARALYSTQAKARIRQAIRAERIDVVYALNISNYISPSIVDGAHAEGVPIVHGLVDYHLVCPNATFNRRGKDRCLDCFPGKYWHGLAHRCVGRSLPASVMRAAVMFFDDLTRVYHRVDAFACLTPFMRDMLAARGFQRDTLHVTLTPIDFSRLEVSTDDDGTFLYVGRISREKGIDILVEAAKRMQSTGSRIIIIGEIDGRYAERCVSLAATGGGAKVEFLGPRYGDEMLAYLRRCRATIMPSRCLDNLPNALLESFAAGKPIVGSNYEGITVVVKDGENGLTFEPGNPADLAAKLDALAADPDRARRMGLAGRRLVEAKHSPEHHYASLMAAFESAVARRKAAR